MAASIISPGANVSARSDASAAALAWNDNGGQGASAGDGVRRSVGVADEGSGTVGVDVAGSAVNHAAITIAAARACSSHDE
jgi:hypothetical protein